MTYAVYATKIEKRISKMEGVYNANVNFALEAISVEYDDKKVESSDMVSAVKKLGYGLIPKQSSEDKMGHQEAGIKKQYRKFIFSAILTLPLLWTMVAHFNFLSFIYLLDIFMIFCF